MTRWPIACGVALCGCLLELATAPLYARETLTDQQLRARQAWIFHTMSLDSATLKVAGIYPISVTVLDQGVVFNHDLAGKNAGQYVYADPYEPDRRLAPDPIDGDDATNHGTRIASLIAADGRRGMRGVFPGATIVSRRTVVGDEDHMVEAVEDVMASVEPAGSEKIINLSAGLPRTTLRMRERWSTLLERMGADQQRVLVAALSNRSRDLRRVDRANDIWPTAYQVTDPARREFDPIIRVASVDFAAGVNPEMAWFSDYGAERIDIAVQGVDIPAMDGNGRWALRHGNSYAAPLVSGVLAAMASCNPRATARQMKDMLFLTADKHANLVDKVTDGRVLNASLAIEMFCEAAEKDLHLRHAAAARLIHDEA